MNIGICTWAFARSAAGRRQVAELSALAGRAGFASLEAAYLRGGTVSADREQPGPLAVPIGSLATLELHRASLFDPRPPQRRRAHQVLPEMLRCAAVWDIPSVSFSPGAPPPGSDSEALLDDLELALAAPVALAGQLSVTLMLENVPGHFLCRLDDMSRALERLPEVSLTLDVGNTLIDPPLTRWIGEFAGRILKIHLSDGTVEDGKFIPAWPGSGAVDWDEVRAGLAALPQARVFVEMPWDGHTDEERFVHRLADTVGALLKGGVS